METIPLTVWQEQMRLRNYANEDYANYIVAALEREGIPVRWARRNYFDPFAFGMLVMCDAPWDQYNRNCKPGTWGRSIRCGETVHDIIKYYKLSYPTEDT
jgi:hypothetical protein